MGDWASLIGAIASISGAFVSVVAAVKGAKEVTHGAFAEQLSIMCRELDELFGLSLEYWTDADQSVQKRKVCSIKIKKSIKNLSTALTCIENKYSSLYGKGFSEVTAEIVKLDAMITGGNFETQSLEADPDKAQKVADEISRLQKVIRLKI